MDVHGLFEGAAWRKSSTSDTGGCIEVAYAQGLIGVRDSKERGRGRSTSTRRRSGRRS